MNSPHRNESVTDKRQRNRNSIDKKVYKCQFRLKGNLDNCVEIETDEGKRFLVYGQSHEPFTVPYVKISDPDVESKKITILPSPQVTQTKLDQLFENELLSGIKFPPMPIEYGSDYELFTKIRNFIHKYVEVRHEDEVLIALYVMKSVLFDVLNDTSFPFIHVLAPYGKGKSRLLFVMCEITPWGFYSIDVKSAPLKRVSALYSPILFVDEKAKMNAELEYMINGKYNRNAVIINADREIQKGYSSLTGNNIFGPMVMAGRTPFEDDAIESKSFQIDMDFERKRKDIPRKLKGDLLDSFLVEAKEIRGMLLSFRISQHYKINQIGSSCFLETYTDHLEERLFEIISFFEDIAEIIPKVKEDLREVIENQTIRNVEVNRETPNGIIALIFLSLAERENEIIEYTTRAKKYRGIRLSSVYDEAGKEYSKETGKILKKLGLKTERPTIDGEKTTVARIPTERIMNELKSRYDPEFIKSTLEGISKSQHTLSDNDGNEDDEKLYTETSENNDSMKSDSPDSRDSLELNAETVLEHSHYELTEYQKVIVELVTSKGPMTIKEIYEAWPNFHGPESPEILDICTNLSGMLLGFSYENNRAYFRGGYES